MTGFSARERVIAARDTGVTEFLVKPFTANDLYKRIDHVIMKPRQFVKSPDFFGPDRRRKFLDGQNIPKRRQDD
jgi:DNA-binding response OmpR family regulator